MTIRMNRFDTLFVWHTVAILPATKSPNVSNISTHMTSYHRHHAPPPVPLPLQVEREMFEELTGETFTFNEELDLMKNYQRDLKPWDVGPETRALADLCLVLMNSNEFVYVR